MSSHKQQLESIVQRFSATHVLMRRKNILAKYAHYPEKIFITAPVDHNGRYIIDYHAIACNANLVYFDGKFYAKSTAPHTNRRPYTIALYSITHAPKIENTEIIGTINQLAQAILDTY